MMSSKPLWREPAGASTESVSVRSIESLETPGPRRRFDAPSSSRLAPPSGRSVAFSIPEGFMRRTRRQMLQPRDLVLQRLVLDPQPRQGRAELLVLRPQPLHFAKQSANQADQLSRRHAFKRITRRQATCPA